MAHRRLRPAGLLVANFPGPCKYWSRHLQLLTTAFEGRVHLGTIPGGDNHIAFAFDEPGFSLDWERLEERAGVLAGQFPLDFSALVHSLREGAELRWAQAARRKSLAIPNHQVTLPCRKSMNT